MAAGSTVTSAPVSASPLDTPTSPSVATADGATTDERKDATVHAVDTFSRGTLRWGYFLLLNAIAGSVAVAFFVSVLYADGLDPYLVGTYRWLLAHPGVTSALAFSPLACSLLVGYGYASRARKRKKLAAQRAAAAGTQATSTEPSSALQVSPGPEGKTELKQDDVS